MAFAHGISRENRFGCKPPSVLICWNGVEKIMTVSLKHSISVELPRMYVEFVKLDREKTFFAMLNYDYFIEKINQGVDFNETYLGKDASKMYFKGEAAEFPNLVRYLKLHGSFESIRLNMQNYTKRDL